MKRSKFFFIALIFVSNTLLLAAGNKVTPVFDQRNWKLGWSQNQGEAVFEEYVLDGETVENWSELVTIQFFPGLQLKTNPDIFEASQKASLASVCPSIKWESLEQTQTERMWKWNIAGCQGQPDQAEIVRLKKTEKGFHIWHYAIKKSPIPTEKEKTWTENLKKISVS